MADDEDYLDSDMQAKQRRLIMRITQGRVLQALISWRSVAIRRKSKKALLAALKPFEHIFCKPPWSRTPEDVRELCRAVQGVPFYDSLNKTVLLETVQRIQLILLDDSELEFTPAAFKSFYVVMAGNVEVIADNYYRAAHEVSYSAETDDGERQELLRTTSQGGATLARSLSRHKSMSRLSLGNLVAEGDAEDSADMFIDEMTESGAGVREMRHKIRNTANSQAANFSYQTLKPGDSFTGRHLDVRNKEKEDSGHAPPKVIAACTEEHRSAALLVIPFDDFLAAAKRRSEQALLRRIEFCCCMPVLRHTPFKELHLLCSYMTEANYEPGAFITCQGKEATHVHILLEGEVGIVLDIFERTGSPAKPPSRGTGGASARPDSMQAKFADLLASKTCTHALLAIRGPGAIIGDDSLRERYIAVNTLAKTAVRTMSVSTQKFKLCMDTLTLNRMAAFRQQLAAAEQLILREHVQVYHHSAQDTAQLRKHTLQWALGKTELPPTLDRSPQRRIKQWKPTGCLGNGKATQSFDRIASGELLGSDAGAGREGRPAAKAAGEDGEAGELPPPRRNKGKGGTLDLKRWGLLAAANTMGLSSPSMDAFLKAVRVQVAAQQEALVRQHEESQKDTLGFAVSKRGQTFALSHKNVESETWMDCRDLVEEKLQAQKFTEMMETAVLLVVELTPAPGQGNVNTRLLCRVCDEVRIRWGASASGRGLQLSRAGPSRWYLHTAIGDAGLRHRPVVREVADCALEMAAAWSAVVAEMNLLPHVFSAGLAIGSLFASYDAGKFLRGLAGRTFDTAVALAAQAAAASPAESAIFLADTAVEALRHTHAVMLERTAYRLLTALSMPYEHNVKTLLGREVDADPVSPGMPSSMSAATAATPMATTRPTAVAVKTGGLTILPPTPPAAPCVKDAPLSPVLSHRAESLIGHGPSALVTPGAFAKPFHAEPNSITQPSTARARVEKSRSLRVAALTSLTVGDGDPAILDDKPETPVRQLYADPSYGSTVSSTSSTGRQGGGHRHSPFQHTGRQSGATHHGQHPQMKHRHRKSVAPQVAVTAAMRGGPTVLRDHKLNHGALVGHATSRAARDVVRQVMGSSQKRHPPDSPPQLQEDITVGEHLPGMGAPEKETFRAAADDDSSRRSLSPSRVGHSNISARPPRRELPRGRAAAAPVTRHYAATSRDSGAASWRGPMFGHMPSAVSGLFNGDGGGSREDAYYAEVDAAAVASEYGDDESCYEDDVGVIYEDDGASVVSGATRMSMRSARTTRSNASRATTTASRRPQGPLPPPSRGAASRRAGGGDTLVTEASAASSSAAGGGLLPMLHERLDALRVSKDCGSTLGAAAYVSAIPAGTMVLLMSSSGLVELPPLGHLHYLEMLAASFNKLQRLPGSATAWAGLPKLQNLSLACNELESLPKDMFRHLPQLREINLGGNRLSALPPSLWELRLLVVLGLSENRLPELPAGVGKLRALQQLHLARNALLELPPELGRLQELQVLDVSGNQLEALPAELAALSSLTSLDASGNSLAELPPAALTGWAALQRLSLSRNRLRTAWGAPPAGGAAAAGASPQLTPREWAGSVLSQYSDTTASSTPRDGVEGGAASSDVTPEELESVMAMLDEREQALGMAEAGSELVQLPALRVLLLDGNKLTAAPEWLPPGLQELNLAGNRLAGLPEWLPLRMGRTLARLSLHHNLLPELPKSFRLMTGLQLLALRGNPLVSVDAGGEMSALYNTGATAGELVRWMRSKPLRKLKLAVNMVRMSIKAQAAAGPSQE